MFRVGEALILGTMMVGQATAFAPNYNRALSGAARIFSLLDRKSKIDAKANEGEEVVRRWQGFLKCIKPAYIHHRSLHSAAT